MTTFVNRATAPQMRIYRAVHGAVRNAAASHKEIQIPPTFAASVAKRAAGTISSQWRDVLAAGTPSDSGGDVVRLSSSQRVWLLDARAGDRSGISGNGGAHTHSGHPTLRTLRHDLGIMAREARIAGQTERLAVLVDVLRMMRE